MQRTQEQKLNEKKCKKTLYNKVEAILGRSRKDRKAKTMRLRGAEAVKSS